MRHIILVALVMMLAPDLAAEPEPPDIYIKVSAKAEGKLGTSSGSGAFTVADNEYGRITLAFYGDGQSFRIRVSGAHVGPVLHTLEEGDGVVHADDLWMTIDLCLKPQVNEYQEIDVSGAMTRMTRVEGDDDRPLYEYSEEKLKFILPNGGSALITRNHVSPWKNIELEISAYTDEPLAHQPRTERFVNLNAGYSLYNEKTAEFEAKDCHCTLGMPVNVSEDIGSCSFRNIFSLDSGDSLLLMTSFTIANVQWHDNNTLTFDFDMSRHYALNPIEADTIRSGGAFINLGEHGLAADKMTIRDFHRKITVSAGEKTEIEIPSDSDNPLPFDFTEMIMLSTEVETKRY